MTRLANVGGAIAGPATLLLAGLLTLAGPSSGRADEPVAWTMASAFSSKLPQFGSLALRLTESLGRVSGGNIQVEFAEPNSLIAPLEMFDAVAIGALDAAWSTPSHWVGKDEALAIFSSVPFGPRAGEYAAWLYYGGGYELMDEIYAQHGIKSLICGVAAPEASGWFREEVNVLEDFQGLKMRFFGLGAKVMDRLGVAVQVLRGGDIYLALARGRIDATEFNIPAIDRTLGFYEVAKHYYFPGWHQQASLLELMMNREKWDALSDTQRAQIEISCGDNFREGLAEGEATQAEVLHDLEARGVTLHRWSPVILKAMEAAWLEVAADLSSKNSNFKKVWDSFSAFRDKNKIWRDHGYL